MRVSLTMHAETRAMTHSPPRHTRKKPSSFRASDAPSPAAAYQRRDEGSPDCANALRPAGIPRVKGFFDYGRRYAAVPKCEGHRPPASAQNDAVFLDVVQPGNSLRRWMLG